MHPGLYIHLPFCRSRCAYCSFASTVYDPGTADRYLAALEKEAALVKEKYGEPHSTIFIGGGTPSALALDQLRRLFSFIPQLPAAGEYSVECNPDSLDHDKLALFADSGVTRLSFGVQTFSEKGLRLLGRRHDAATAIRAIEAAKKFPFNSISVDLISAWPGQSLKEAEADLRTAASLGVKHISCYNLIAEEGTILGDQLLSGAIAGKGDEEMREFWDLSKNVLSREGFIHYETSNFSLPGYHCRHNCDCWRGRDYVGIGASAHSHLEGKRFANHPDPVEYSRSMEEGGTATVFSEQLEKSEKARETAVFWLRLADGIELDEFQGRTGFELPRLYEKELPGLLSRGCLEFFTNASGKRSLRLTEKCYPLADMVLMDLV